MKGYEEVARDVFRRRDAYEEKIRRRGQILRRVTTVMSVFATTVLILCTVGVCYAIAAGVGVVDDFLGIFGPASEQNLSDEQKQYIVEAVAEIGESVTCDGFTVTAKGAFTDGTTAYVLLDVTAPEGVSIEQGIGFDVDAKQIFRGDNPEKYLDGTGLGYGFSNIDDGDGKANTTTVLFDIESTATPGGSFSFADGYDRYLELTDLGAYLETYPYSRYTIADGTWKFKIQFEDVGTEEVELLSFPMPLTIRRTLSADEMNVILSSIRLKGLSLSIFYTIDQGEIPEPGDFDNVEIILKDGSTVTAYLRASQFVGNDLYFGGFVTGAPVPLEEVDHIVLQGEHVIPVQGVE